MNQYNEISTLQYMGSKARIISHICDPIMKNKSIQTVVDLFAGTGSVGYALKSYKNVISNIAKDGGVKVSDSAAIFNTFFHAGNIEFFN